MARYKTIDTSPKFLPVVLSRQLLPGTFEHALLKLILFAYSRGIVSSGAIERARCEHVTFIAMWGNSSRHFTMIANVARNRLCSAKIRAIDCSPGGRYSPAWQKEAFVFPIPRRLDAKGIGRCYT